MRGCVVAWSAVLLLLSAAPRAQGPAPLPEPGPFSTAVRENLARAEQAQIKLAYKERRTELHTNPFGRIGTGDTVVHEVIPNADGTVMNRRLVERAGKAVTDSPVERREVRARGRPRSSMDDAYAALAFTIERREILNGQRVIVVSFKPRPEAKPTTRDGRLAQSFHGVIWVNEDAREVEKVEALAAEPLSFGYGIVAKLSEGTAVTLVRAPVAGGFWMPVSIRFAGEGRAMLFRKLKLDFAIDWFEYRLVSGGL